MYAFLPEAVMSIAVLSDEDGGNHKELEGPPRSQLRAPPLILTKLIIASGNCSIVH